MLIVIIFTRMSSAGCISGGWDWRRGPIFLHDCWCCSRLLHELCKWWSRICSFPHRQSKAQQVHVPRIHQQGRRSLFALLPFVDKHYAW